MMCKLARRAGLSAVVIAALSGSGAVEAADLYAPPRSAPELRAFDTTPWTGAYVGLSLGRSWGSTRIDTTTGNFTIDTNGGQFAGYAGYTWQSGMFVLGGEVELAGGSLTGSNVNVAQDLNWMGAVRARAGLLVTQPLYVYGLAGLAFADMTMKVNGVARDQDFTGFQVGAGAEYRFNPNWSLRLDYIYTGLGSERRDFPGTSRQVDPDFSTVRAGVSFRF